MEDALFTSLTIAVGLIVLLAAYSLIPLCIAFLSKTPIAKKLYSTLCVANTALICLIITAAAYSDEPFFSITLAIALGYVAYRIGLSRLKKKNLLLGNEAEPPKQDQSVVDSSPVEYEQLEITVEPASNTETPAKAVVGKSIRTVPFVTIACFLIIAALVGGYCLGRYGTKQNTEDNSGYASGYDDGYKKGFSNGKQIACDMQEEYSSGGNPTVHFVREFSVSEKREHTYVYVSPYDGHYHSVSCKEKGNPVYMSIAYADEFGFIPCLVCRPSV